MSSEGGFGNILRWYNRQTDKVKAGLLTPLVFGLGWLLYKARSYSGLEKLNDTTPKPARNHWVGGREDELEARVIELENRLGGGAPQASTNFWRELKRFYYEDSVEALSQSAFIHDGVGYAVAFGVGRMRVRPIIGYAIALGFAQVPEVVNVFNSYITSGEFFNNLKWDAGIIAGSWVLGRFSSAINFGDSNVIDHVDDGEKPTWWSRK